MFDPIRYLYAPKLPPFRGEGGCFKAYRGLGNVSIIYPYSSVRITFTHALARTRALERYWLDGRMPQSKADRRFYLGRAGGGLSSTDKHCLVGLL